MIKEAVEEELLFINPSVLVPVTNEFARLWKRAKRYFEEKNYQASLNVLERIEKIGYELEVAKAKGLTYEMLGDHESARKTFIEVLRRAKRVGAKDLVYPLKVRHACNKGYDLHYRRKKTDQAIKILKKALEKTPDKIEPHIALARIYEDKKDLTSEIEEIEKIIPLEKGGKKKAEWLLLKGDVLRNLGDYQRAEEILEEAIDLRPDYAKPYALRGYLRAREGKDELALADWEKAEVLGYQGSGPFYLLLTTVYLNRGNHPQVLKMIDKILERHPSQVKGLFGLFHNKEGYDLLFYKLFNQLRSAENPLSEEDVIRMLRGAVLNRRLALEVLKEQWIERTTKIEGSLKRGKKIKGR